MNTAPTHTLTAAQSATFRGLERSFAALNLDGWEQDTSDPTAAETCARVHAVTADGERFGYVIAPDGDLVAASPLNADGEPIDG